MTKMTQTTFLPPPMSCRRNRSAKTVIRSQNQITHAKITNNVRGLPGTDSQLRTSVVSFLEPLLLNATGGVWRLLPPGAATG